MEKLPKRNKSTKDILETKNTTKCVTLSSFLVILALDKIRKPGLGNRLIKPIISPQNTKHRFSVFSLHFSAKPLI